MTVVLRYCVGCTSKDQEWGWSWSWRDTSGKIQGVYGYCRWQQSASFWCHCSLWVLYQVLCEVLLHSNSQATCQCIWDYAVSSSSIEQCSATMHEPPLTIRNKRDALYNDVLSWLSPWSSASESKIDERVAAWRAVLSVWPAWPFQWEAFVSCQEV